VVVLEAHTDDDHASVQPLLEAQRYICGHYDGINRYYVRAEDSDVLDRLRPPVSSLDSFTPYRYVEVLENLQAELGNCGGDTSRARSMIAETIGAMGAEPRPHITNVTAPALGWRQRASSAFRRLSG